MKRWVSCPAEVTYLLIIPGQYEKCVAVLWFLFELHKFFAAHACLQPIAFVRSFMLWVRRLHFAVLLFGDRLLACFLLCSGCAAYAGEVYLSVTIFSGAVVYTLRAGHTQYRFTFSVTLSLCVVFYALRAGHTQYRFTDVLGRQPGEYTILYLLNQMGHA